MIPTAKIPIKPIGAVLLVDDNGYLVSVSSTDKIKPPWTEVADFAKAAYLEHLGDRVHSIYIRGSVAKGTAIEGISDLDTLAVMSGDAGVDMDWAGAINDEARRRFSFCQKIEIQGILYNGLMNLDDAKCRSKRTLIKTQTACVYGPNLATAFPEVRPGKDIAGHAYSIKRDLQLVKEIMNESETSQRLKQRCTWIMKRLLRTGFELIMERERVYTRDLYPCYKLFAKHYPDKDQQMRQALELALNPTDERYIILEIVENLGLWVVEEAAKTFQI